MPSRRTLLLTSREIRSLLTIEECLKAVEESFRAQGRKRVLLPEKIYLTLPDGISDFRAMPALIEGVPFACGVKWVNVHPKNRKRGLPTVMALILLNDPSSGFPLAVMDGTVITQMRTGAAGAIAARVLARRNSRTLGLIGCGTQAETQLSFLLKRFPLKQVFFWGPTEANRREFLHRMKTQKRLLRPSPSIEEVARSSDILTTVTPSRRPLVKAAWVRPGTHINAIGADAKGKEELDPILLKRSRVIVDHVAQSCHSGELNVPFSKGLITKRDIDATLGEIVAGTKEGRRFPEEITVFDATGLAIQDVAVASRVYRKAIRSQKKYRTVSFL